MADSPTVKKDFIAVLSFRVGSTISYQMMMVAVGWHIFHLTHDVLSLGLLGLAELIPYFGCALFAGHIVDIYSRKKIAAIASVIHLAMGLFLMCIALGFFHSPVMYIYGAVAGLGIGRAFLRPSYQSIFGQVIPRNLTAKYSAYASSAFQACVVSGPAIGGLLIASIGLPGTYLFAGLCALYGLYGVYLLRVREPIRPSHQLPFFESFLEGIRFIRHQPFMLSAMSLDMLAVLFGGAVSMLPAFVSDVLHEGPQALGLLRAAPAIGAILMGVYFAKYPIHRHSGKYLLGSIFGFGVSIIAFSLTRQLWVSCVFLFLSGCFDCISVLVRTTIFQLTSPNHLRGRISAINGIFIGSSNELGALESGVAANLMGLTPSIAFGGMVTLFVAMAFYQYAPRLRRLHIQDLVDDA